ncbi:terminase family protein [Shewanella sp. Iso12]|uniref:terminase large subunit domain-containing protein n=1 Tax=Shewanella sp. Iso12 TaxID=1826753 RepID=UPI00142F5C9F|nr:terminase family protein [Shewanella algae]NJI84799.1 TerL [Shewanella sp. Iso12]
MAQQQEIEFWVKPQGEVLRQYMELRDRVTMIMGPIGSGKTYCSAMRVFDQMCEQTPNANGVRKSRWAAVRNTYTDLKNTTIKDWCDLYHNEEVILGRLVMDSPPTHYLDFDLEDGTRVLAELVFFALDRPDSVRKLRGFQATGFWLNEVKELSKPIVDMCDGRHGRYPSNAEVSDYWHGMIGDTNAPDDDHWYYKLAEETKPEGWTFLRQPGGVTEEVIGKGEAAYSIWRPNPEAENLNNLPDGYYIRMIQGKDDDWIRVNLANDYGTIVTGKPIYRGSYKDPIHVARNPTLPIKSHGKLLLGFDFGRTPACIVGQLTVQHKLRVLKEYISEDMGIRKFMKELIPQLRKDFPAYTKAEMEGYCDPSGWAKSGNDENSPIEIINREFKIRAYSTSSNKPEHRWEAVRFFLNGDIDGAPAFELSPVCKVIRKGFISGYHFRRLKVSGDERYHSEADKNRYSHPHDALQYLAQGAQGEIDYERTDQLYQTTAQTRAADSKAGY